MTTIPQATLVGLAIIAVSVLGASWVSPEPEWQITTYPMPGNVGAIARLNTRTGDIEICSLVAPRLAGAQIPEFAGSAQNPLTATEYAAWKHVVAEADRTHCFPLQYPTH